MLEDVSRTCCFFGHREIQESEGLKTRLSLEIERLITTENVHIFLFGSKSRFDSLCLALVTALQEKYPHIRRVYVRAEYPVITDDYRAYVLKSYEETYYPKGLQQAGRAVYLQRNRVMIQNSRFCVVYYDKANAPTTRKSGTEAALAYAVKLKKEMILLP